MIKDFSENIKVLISIFNRLTLWASTSTTKQIFVILLIYLVLMLAPFTYYLVLDQESEKFNNQKLESSKDLNTENGYLITIDYLNACIKNNENKDWYCNRAKDRYKRSSKNWPQAKVKEYIEKDLFLAMKISVSHYLRSIKFSQNIRREYKNQKQFDLIATKWSFFLFFVIATILSLIFAIKLGSQKNRA